MGKEGKPVQVKEILTAMVLIDATIEEKNINRITVHVSSLSGLPVTAEILRKLGFIRDGSYYVKGYFSFPVMPTKNGDELFMVPNDNMAAISIKYVHKLQNIYFALTETEIPVNL